jgi:predicted nucleic acid-binding protein
VTLVVDASVALKWFLPDEPNAERAIGLIRAGTVLIAPDIIIAEVCNGAWRSARLGRLSRAQADEIAIVVPRFFETLVSAAELAPRAVALAGELDHPVYDCLYLALAETARTRVITADLRFLERLRTTPWGASVSNLTDYPNAESRNR